MRLPDILDEPTDDQWEQYVSIAERSFGVPLPDAPVQRSNGLVRLAADAKGVIGGAIALPFTQYFGGRPLSSAGLSLVCVDPSARGVGVARMVVDSLVDHLRERGVALVALWTPSPGIYRRWGWEVAGGASAYTVPVTSLRTMPRRHSSVVADPDPGSVFALHAELASHWDGALHRPRWWWGWKASAAAQERHHYGVANEDRLDGYVAYSTQPLPEWGQSVVVEDLWARDGGTFSALCTFLSKHSSFTPHIRFAPGVLPSPPELSLWLPQYDWHEHPWHPWMLRIIDIESALTTRGWPVGVRANISLRMVDGPMAGTELDLMIEDGKARLGHGGGRQVMLTERGAAAWFSGCWSASRLARAGLITTGDAHALATMDSLVATRPWLPDRF